uniref:Uncharacterized protein n=1 Tax=uncultured bacterium scaffold00090 TaxID=1132476 RepID=I7AI28_9BACT|nr:hypothetical protein [uncultured bacterium scaffold00090]
MCLPAKIMFNHIPHPGRPEILRFLPEIDRQQLISAPDRFLCHMAVPVEKSRGGGLIPTGIIHISHKMASSATLS